MRKSPKKRSTRRKSPIKRSTRRKSTSRRKSPVKRKSTSRRKSPTKRKSTSRRKSPTKRKSTSRRKSPVKRKSTKRRVSSPRKETVYQGYNKQVPSSYVPHMKGSPNALVPVHQQQRLTALQYNPSLSYLDVLPYLSKIKAVEGPVRYLVLTPTPKLKNMLGRNPPTIVGLGDSHRGRQKCASCKPVDGCYTLYEAELNGNSLLGYFNKIGERFQVDFFYEAWVTKQWRKQSARGNVIEFQGYENGSALYDITDFVTVCSMKHTNVAQYISCPYKTMNTHYVDVRKNFRDATFLEERNGELVIADPSIKDYSEIFDNIDGLLMYMKQMSFSFAQFKKIFEGAFRGERVGDVLDLILKRFELGADRFYKTVFRTNPLMIKYSKVHKQIRQLPQELQDIMYTYDIWSFDNDFRLPNAGGAGDQRSGKSDEEKYETVMSTLVNDITNLDAHWLSVSGVDIYYMARTLKIPSRKSLNVDAHPTQLSLVYLGDNHIANIKDFLVRNRLFEVDIEARQRDLEDKCVIVKSEM